MWTGIPFWTEFAAKTISTGRNRTHESPGAFRPLEEATMTQLEKSLQKSPEFPQQAKKAALSRWKLETLTGLLGIRSLQKHQQETEKNQAAENKFVRNRVWESQEPESDGEEMGGHTILGDVQQQPPIIFAGQQGSGIGKMLAGAAIATALIGIPGAGVAGYFLSQLINRPQPQQQVQPTPPAGDDFDMDFDLLQWEDLKNFGKGKQ